MRSSIVLGATAQRDLARLKEGDVVDGTVHRITDFGVFVSILDTSLIGLSRKHLAASTSTADLNDVFDIGDRVKAKVMGISGHKVSLGLKPSLFGNGDSDDDEQPDNMDVAEENSDDSDDELVLVDEDQDSEEEHEIQEMLRAASMQAGDSDEEGDEDDMEDGGDDNDEDEEHSDDDDECEESDDGDDSEEEDGREDDIGTVLPASKKARVLEATGSAGSSQASTLPSASVFTNTAGSTSLLGGSDTLFLDWGNSFQPPTTGASLEEDADASEDSDVNSDDEKEKSSGRKRGHDSLRAEADIRKREVIHDALFCAVFYVL